MNIERNYRKCKSNYRCQLKMLNFIVSNHLGDLASVIGLAVTLTGFIITIYNVIRTKTAAELAKDSVSKITKEMSKADIISNLSTAIGVINEIKRLHTTEEYNFLLNRFQVLRDLLIVIKSYDNIVAGHESLLTSIIQHVSDTEKKLFEKIKNPSMAFDMVTPYSVISDKSDILLELSEKIKRSSGG